MQTFLPYPNFARSAACLDRQRLGKQRVEAKQIYLALTQPAYGWQNHPAVRMWRGHESALLNYGAFICDEWIKRGYADTLKPFFLAAHDRLSPPFGVVPPWLGNPAFHAAHQSNLIRKLPSHYGPLFPGVPDNLPYIWPV